MSKSILIGEHFLYPDPMLNRIQPIPRGSVILAFDSVRLSEDHMLLYSLARDKYSDKLAFFHVIDAVNVMGDIEREACQSSLFRFPRQDHFHMDKDHSKTSV